MSARRRSVRSRIWTLLVIAFATLTPLWGFAIYLTVPDAVSLNRQEQRHLQIGVPIDNLDTALSAERKATAVYLADPSIGTGELDKARAATDKAARIYRHDGVDAVHRIGQDATQGLSATVVGQLGELSAERRAIDSGAAGPGEMYAYYKSTINTGLRILNSLTGLNGQQLQSWGEALSRLTRSRSLLEETDARVSAAIARGSVTTGDRFALISSYGSVQGSYATALPNLPGETADASRALINGPLSAKVGVLLQRVANTRPGAPIKVTAKEWDDAVGTVLKLAHRLELRTAVELGHRAEPVATEILVRAGVATGFGLLGVIALIVVSVRIGRGMIREIRLLRNGMDDAAYVQLPELVRRLRAGRDVAADQLGPSRTGRLRTRELDDLSRSFDGVRRVAIDSASGEARLRQGVSQVFVNLSRRNQSLLHRQLKLLDQVERQSADPDQLSQLFTLDHLATRMRRHAESLIILSGSSPGRGWSHPVPMLDVVRSAVTEVEDYPRVTVHLLPAGHLVGTAVADVIHLLAELIENAALYSPGDSPVQVRGIRAANGFVVEIEDAGAGMSEETLESVNRELAEPPEFDLSAVDRLGLFVVGQLAIRHGIRVSLRASPYGGTTAIVLLPNALLAQAEPAPADTRPAEPAPPVPAAPPPVNGARWMPAAPPADPVGAGPAQPDLPSLGVASPVQPDLPSLGVLPVPENPLDLAPDADRPALPRRNRQTSLAPQLRQNATGTPEPESARERSPEEVRTLMSAIQQGWSGVRPTTGTPDDRTAPEADDD